MRRIAFILSLVAATVAAVVTTSAAGDDTHTYYIEMDNAFGLTDGSEVKVAGVSAGTVTDLFINSRKRAVVKVELSGPVAVLGEGTICSSEPQSLIAEYFIDCTPKGDPIETTDESEDDRIAELIREAALDGVRDELPHSLAATVDDREEREDGLLELYASLYVERDSQKGIVIGKGGSRLRDVGERARKGIEQLLGRRVYLSLRVKVLKEWQRDPKALGRLGF